MFILAEASNTDAMSWVAPVIQLVTAGGFGALVWYLVVKHIPSIEKRHADERKEWLEKIEERDTKFEGMTREFITILAETKSEFTKFSERMKNG